MVHATYTYIYIHTYLYMYMCIYIYTHVYIYICTNGIHSEASEACQREVFQWTWFILQSLGSENWFRILEIFLDASIGKPSNSVDLKLTAKNRSLGSRL